jgi:hypothetical protein
MQTQLNGSLEGCKKILHEGSSLYQSDSNAAVAVWHVFSSSLSISILHFFQILLYSLSGGEEEGKEGRG